MAEQPSQTPITTDSSDTSDCNVEGCIYHKPIPDNNRVRSIRDYPIGYIEYNMDPKSFWDSFPN